MKQLYLILLVLIASFSFCSCSDDDSIENQAEKYSYSAINSDVNMVATVSAILDEKVVINIDAELNKDAIKSLDEKGNMNLLLQSDCLWILAKDWPTSLSVGDKLTFKLKGYGVLQNNNAPSLDFPPVRFYVEPSL